MKKHVLIKNCLQLDLTQGVWVEKTVHRVETYWISGKENVPGAAVKNEGHADCILRSMTSDFLDKKLL